MNIVIQHRAKQSPANAFAFILFGVFLVSCQHAIEPLTESRKLISLSDTLISSNILYLDAFASDKSVVLYWKTYESNTLPAPFTELKLYLSTYGFDSGFTEIYRSTRQGEDSTIVKNLENDVPYYFRLATMDSLGTINGISKPRMVTAGPLTATTASFQAFQAEPPLYVSSISWHPDGNIVGILRTDNPPSDMNIYLLNLSTKIEKKLTDFRGRDYRLLSVDFSPDGQTIAYCYTQSSTFYQIDYRVWLLPVSGGTAVRATSGRVDGEASWASSTSLVFSKGTYEPPNIHQIYLVDLSNGNSEKAVTTDQVLQKFTPSLDSASKMVVFSGEGIAGRDLYIVSLDENQVIQITSRSDWQDIHPSWIHGTNKLTFSSDRAGHFEVWSIDIQTRRLLQITRCSRRFSQYLIGRLSPDGTKVALLHVGESFATATLDIAILN
jgi:WD40 repeat protein